MNPSKIFIERPVATSLMMAGVVLVGFVAFRQLPVSALPQVDYPTMQIQTFYPGASPEVMTSSVTAPMEKQFGQIPGMTQMTSVSSFGSSLITLQFALDLNIDIAEQEVQAAINAAGTFLPTGLPTPPIYSKTNPADAPILTVAITSDTMPLSKVEDLAETRMAQRISQLKGVGLVSISGGQRPAVRVQANPTALASYGLSMETLRSALGSANANAAKGNFDGLQQSWTINDNDQIQSGSDYAKIIIAYRNGAPVRLSDVATVIDGVENKRQAAWVNSTPGIVLNIQRQPGSSIINVVDTIQQLLPQMQASMPEGVKIRVITDRTTTIRASVEDVEFELILTIVLVVAVIFVFLRSVSATIIPGIAVPLSLIGTFAVMYMLGYSLDNLSLMALTISTGFVVDAAIVMIENISRYIEMGFSPMAAAFKGSEEIGFTVVSLTVSLIAVLIPLLFMADIVGRLFREFAVTLAVAIIFSAFVSLTLTPMMAGRILKHKPEHEQGRFYHWSETVFVRIIAGYGRGVRFVLRHQPATLLVAVGTLAATIYFYIVVPKGFFPVQDTGIVLGISQAPETISFPAMAERQQALVAEIVKDPAVQDVTSFIGIDGINTTLNSGRIQMTLRPLEERKMSATEVIRRLGPKLAQVPGIALFMQPVQDLTVEDRISRTQYQYSLDAPDKATLDTWVPRLVDNMKKIPELRDVASDQQNNGLGLLVDIDRDTAGRFGITPQNVDDALYDAFGQRQVSTIFTQANQYHVVLEAGTAWSQNVDAMKDVYVQVGSASANLASTVALAGTNTALTGAAALSQAPLRTFTKISAVPIPITINHQGQFPVVTVSFNLAPGASLGEAVQHIRDVTKQTNMPASIEPSFQGTARAFENSLANESILIVAALVTVYIVLGVLYESYIHPITILSTLPSAGVGAIAALILFHEDLDIIGLIGIILLIGIVKKNAIMMIDFALEAERKEGKGPQEAIYQACLLRFRPIMMTTMAALLGAVPLAFGNGVGSEMRKPLGISIIGGLMVSQVLTLYTTPVVYLWFDRIAKWVGGRSKSPDQSAGDMSLPELT
ncbi:MAG TPA: multidrug efflux RND transporter permease subunit [Bryobacteraceae bacterium]|jgi:multidrug efflux pump|nr:multidrug efflux RND transporter permease subunit [Bryobacteraceae bacterium]